eukprot:5382629-Amphidinium_carterae.1
MLDAQIEKLKAGRLHTLRGLQDSLTEAHQSGHETLQKEFSGSFLELSNFFSQREQRLKKAGVESEKHTEEQRSSSFVELSDSTKGVDDDTEAEDS